METLNGGITFQPKERVKKLAERLGFHRDAEIPAVTPGEALIKFHGEPAVIPAQKDGDSLVEGTQFTAVQLEAIQGLEAQRIAAIRQELAQSERIIG